MATKQLHELAFYLGRLELNSEVVKDSLDNLLPASSEHGRQFRRAHALQQAFSEVFKESILFVFTMSKITRFF